MLRSSIGRERLVALQVLFLALVAFTTAIYLASGLSLFQSAVMGFVHGGISFIAVVLLALAYLGAKTVLEPGS